MKFKIVEIVTIEKTYIVETANKQEAFNEFVEGDYYLDSNKVLNQHLVSVEIIPERTDNENL